MRIGAVRAYNKNFGIGRAQINGACFTDLIIFIQVKFSILGKRYANKGDHNKSKEQVFHNGQVLKL
jgi:hypothetical protein